MGSDGADRIDLQELLGQFQSARVHFVNSQREMLLAFREVCRILEEFGASTTTPFAWDLPLYMVKAVGAVIDYFLARVPEQGKPQDILAAKIQAIDEIITILDEEGQRVGSTAKNQVDLAKVEAIHSIKKYLLVEKEVAQDEAKDREKDQRIRKVVIE